MWVGPWVGRGRDGCDAMPGPAGLRWDAACSAVRRWATAMLVGGCCWIEWMGLSGLVGGWEG